MILIQGHIRVHADDLPALRALAASMVAASRAEPGCVAYAFAEDLGEPGLVHIVERWESQAALDAHNKSAHLSAFTASLPSLRILGLRVAAYEAEAERVLLGG